MVVSLFVRSNIKNTKRGYFGREKCRLQNADTLCYYIHSIKYIHKTYMTNYNKNVIRFD